MKPLVSICLPNLNTRPFLEARMETIMAQTLGDWELIVCDSYSTDGSWEYFQQFMKDPRLRLCQVPRAGVYAGFNECLQRARGEYVYIAPGDDTCRPELLEKLVTELERVKSEKCKVKGEARSEESGKKGQESVGRRPWAVNAKEVENNKANSPYTLHLLPSTPHLPADIAACGFDYIDERDHVIDPAPMGRAGDFYGDWLAKPHRRSGLLEFLVHLWLGVSWTTLTAMVFRRSLLEKAGLFRTDAGAGADMYWAVKTALHSDTLWIPDRLATWRWHAGQKSVGNNSRYRVGEGVRVNRQRVALMGETIDECRDSIPASWRADPNWREKLLWGARQYYRASFCLDRDSIRSHQTAFFKGLGLVFLFEPRFLARRLSGGFSWESDECSDWSKRLHDLIREWEVSWPPVFLTSGQ